MWIVRLMVSMHYTSNNPFAHIFISHTDYDSDRKNINQNDVTRGLRLVLLENALWIPENHVKISGHPAREEMW